MESNLNDAISAEIRAHMARKRISGSALAAELRWNQAFLNRRLRGAVPWGVAELPPIAASLGISVIDLVDPRGELLAS